MKILITGSSGQVGRALRETAGSDHRVHAFPHEELNITDSHQVASVFDALMPDLVINAAAFTAVDAAERNRNTAFAVNADGVENLAVCARNSGSRLIHISTDYVFDGAKSTPYTASDRPNPINVYGKSKLEGETRLIRILGGDALILRTSWVYAADADNFVTKMLQLFRQCRELGIVSDQRGSPTWARSLARTLWCCVERPDVAGVQHWTDTGDITWHDFAVAVRDEGLALGLVPGSLTIRAISTAEYPTDAARPRYSVLDTSDTAELLGLRPDPWRHNLRRMLREIADGDARRGGGAVYTDGTEAT